MATREEQILSLRESLKNSDDVLNVLCEASIGYKETGRKFYALTDNPEDPQVDETRPMTPGILEDCYPKLEKLVKAYQGQIKNLKEGCQALMDVLKGNPDGLVPEAALKEAVYYLEDGAALYVAADYAAKLISDLQQLDALRSDTKTDFSEQDAAQNKYDSVIQALHTEEIKGIFFDELITRIFLAETKNKLEEYGRKIKEAMKS